MASGHLMFEEESSWGTWTTPTKALPVIDSGLLAGANQPPLDNQSTGLGGRGKRASYPGEFTVAGPINALVYPVTFGFLLRSLMPTRAVAAAGTGPLAGYLNKFLPDDDVANDSFSMQERQSASLAGSVKGAKINRWMIQANIRDYARQTLDMIAQDAAMSASTWTDGTSAPAVVDPSALYDANQPDAFKFYEGVMRLGGTVAETSGELVVSGGTARNDFDQIQVEVNANLGTDGLGVNIGNRVLQSLDEGARDITIQFQPNFALVGSNGAEFYDAWKAGTPAVVELFFQGPEYANAPSSYKHELKLTFPQVRYSGPAPMVNVSRSYGLRRVPVQGVAEVDESLGYDWGFTLQTIEDLVT